VFGGDSYRCRDTGNLVGIFTITGCASGDEVDQRLSRPTGPPMDKALLECNAAVMFASADHVRGFAAIVAKYLADLATAMEHAEAGKETDNA
jgi:hypothetical protein